MRLCAFARNINFGISNTTTQEKCAPTITLSDVHAALAYYYDHKQEIQQQIEQDETLEAQMRVSIPSKIPDNR